jgi:glutaredoxin
MFGTRQIPWIVTIALALAACSGNGDGSQETGAAEPALPSVTDQRTDLVLSWFVDGGPQTASTVADVPATARAEVRVQDPSVPPEKRDPGWIFLADLRIAGADGSYPVRAERREEYESRRRIRLAALAKQQQQQAATAATAPLQIVPTPAGDGAPVIMYANQTCPVCRKARRWLLDQKIPYVEKDIQRDKAAAIELITKGKAQGVPTGGVPVFDVGGKLIPGLDKAAIRKALTGSKPTPPTEGVI